MASPKHHLPILPKFMLNYPCRENSVKLFEGKSLRIIIFVQNEQKLYVGGLSYQTTDDTLSASFAQAGTVVSATVIKDKFSGQSKGFGFVEMATEEEATAAIAMWDGKELDGRTVKVNEARPLEDRPPVGTTTPKIAALLAAVSVVVDPDIKTI